MMAARLEDNVFNRGQKPHEAKFKIWNSAGLMLSYWCPGRCACCYVFSGPEAGSSETEMNTDLALDCWRSIKRLGGERGKVHITGGEPFGNYNRLKQILQLACEEQLGGLEKIETNAYWCQNAELVRERLTELKELGLKKLQISTDVYHQEYIPIEQVRLAARIAQEILGPEGVQVRWADFLAEPVLVKEMSSQDRQEAFRRALAQRPERLLGRAAVELSSLFQLRNYNSFTDDNCASRFLGARHIHIDGAGNVFSGTCIGIIIGNIRSGGSLDELWRSFDFRVHPITSVLAGGGARGS